jgi:hypothetical protein
MGKNVAIAFAYLACRFTPLAKATTAGGEIEGFHGCCCLVSPSTTYAAITELVMRMEPVDRYGCHIESGYIYVRHP